MSGTDTRGRCPIVRLNNAFQRLTLPPGLLGREFPSGFPFADFGDGDDCQPNDAAAQDIERSLQLTREVCDERRIADMGARSSLPKIGLGSKLGIRPSA